MSMEVVIELDWLMEDVEKYLVKMEINFWVF